MPSDSTTFLYSQNAAFQPTAGTSEIKYLECFKVGDRPRTNVTGVFGTSTGSSTDKFPQYKQGVEQVEYIGYGVVNPNGGDTFGCAQDSTVTLGTLLVQLSWFEFTKSWQLEPVTAGTSAEYLSSLPEVHFEGRGVATGASGPLSNTKSEDTTATIFIDEFGQLSLGGTNDKLLYNRMVTGMHPMRGGGVSVEFDATFHKNVTYAQSTATNSWGWLFPTPDRAVKGNLKWDPGETETISTLYYSLTITNKTSRGGAIEVISRMRKDAA